MKEYIIRPEQKIKTFNQMTRNSKNLIKRIRIKSISFTIICLLLLNHLLSQTKKAVINEYNKGKENITSTTPVNVNNRMEVYKHIDYLTRLVWGKIKPKLIDKKKCVIGGLPVFLDYYDYNNDNIPDLFQLVSLEGKELYQEFGFLYDLNKDGKTDYIVYYGGFGSEFNYYFYHWIDSNFDGEVDILTYNIFVPPGASAPNYNIVLWVFDKDYNKKPDVIDFINIQNMQIDSLKANDGIWDYKTLFGEKKINANDDSTFILQSEFLKAINQ